jgi:hypothetical protein
MARVRPFLDFDVTSPFSPSSTSLPTLKHTFTNHVPPHHRHPLPSHIVSTLPVFPPFLFLISFFLHSLRSSLVLPARLNSTSAAKPPADSSATQQQHPSSSSAGNTTSHSPNASQHNSKKDPLKDKQEAEAAEAGPAVAEGKYGPGAPVRLFSPFLPFFSSFLRLLTLPFGIRSRETTLRERRRPRTGSRRASRARSKVVVRNCCKYMSSILLPVRRFHLLS